MKSFLGKVPWTSLSVALVATVTAIWGKSLGLDVQLAIMSISGLVAGVETAGRYHVSAKTVEAGVGAFFDSMAALKPSGPTSTAPATGAPTPGPGAVTPAPMADASLLEFKA